MTDLPGTAPASRSGVRDTGSFRDADSAVFHIGDDVYRGLTAAGAEGWNALRDSPLFGRLVAQGMLIPTVEAGVDVLADASDGYVTALRHERVPFVSYPYEWSFEMLRDAALLQLELLLAALDEGLILKDASPYNVQWRGARPTFVDVGSFERLREGEPWVGYRQFCMLFLYPLLLQAYKGFDFQPLLRGRLDGITPVQCRALLGWRDVHRRGVMTHVILHSRLERRHAARESDSRAELRRAGFNVGLVRANIRRLEGLVRGLRWRPRVSEWSGYAGGCTYSETDAARKAEFVRAACAGVRPGVVWDLGCNDGRYSAIAAEHAETVLAIDGDHAVVDALYQSLRAAPAGRILPLVVDIADPSPSLGWRAAERSPIWERGRPDLVLALALVHHLAITRNIPLEEQVAWLASLGAPVVVEVPARDDEMVRRLLARKGERTRIRYDLPLFEAALGASFEIVRREALVGGDRVLYLARPLRTAARRRVNPAEIGAGIVSRGLEG